MADANSKPVDNPKFAPGTYVCDTADMQSSPLYGWVLREIEDEYKAGGTVTLYKPDLVNSNPHWNDTPGYGDEDGTYYTETKYLRAVAEPAAEILAYYEAITAAAT